MRKELKNFLNDMRANNWSAAKQAGSGTLRDITYGGGAVGDAVKKKLDSTAVNIGKGLRGVAKSIINKDNEFYKATNSPSKKTLEMLKRK